MGTIGLSPFANDENGKSKAWYEYAVYLGSLAVIPVIMKMVAKTEYTDYFMYTIGPVAIIYVIVQALKYDWQVQKKLIAAMVFIVFSILFWAFFEQSGGSLSLFAANNLDNNLLGGLVTADPNGVNNAANSLFVIILAPLIGLLWIFLSKRNKEPNTIVKFGLGFIFLAMAFYVFYTTRFFANLQGTTSLDVFTTAYLIITLGELCLSPIGLSIMTKLSPEKMQGVMMGMWFLASAYGQYVAGILGAGMTSPNENATASEKLISYTDGYQQLSIYALICGLVLILIAPQVRKLMGNVK
jgi:POT family proton-dependent oligopeptide transporter